MKDIYYNNEKHEFYIREKGENIEGIKWADCPYNRSETKPIEDLAISYENAINSAEWLEEKEAKEAFLAAGPLIVSFFITSEDAKKQLLGDIKQGAGNVVSAYGISKIYNYIKDNIPDDFKDVFKIIPFNLVSFC